MFNGLSAVSGAFPRVVVVALARHKCSRIGNGARMLRMVHDFDFAIAYVLYCVPHRSRISVLHISTIII